jgi:hypothetical protein
MSKKPEWVTYNANTATYDTPDGTKVSSELVESVACLADVLYIAIIRNKQRDVMKEQAMVDAEQELKHE